MGPEHWDSRIFDWYQYIRTTNMNSSLFQYSLEGFCVYKGQSSEVVTFIGLHKWYILVHTTVLNFQK